VRLGSIEPNTLTPAIIDLIAGSKAIAPHLHVPMQSGSAPVLRAMRRRYSPQMYRAVIERVHEVMPHAAIGIDVITGFPTETPAEFDETVDLLKSMAWSYLHVFTYSERSDTDAAAMTQRVDVAERRERTRQLRQLSDERTEAFHRGQLGTTRMFLPEGYEVETGRWTGWTENHVAVSLSAPEDFVKRPTRVALIACNGGSVEAVAIDHSRAESSTITRPSLP
jgi:threonylcarbamoyladenosine tRNA methylthiotransferase MtaB